jgi:hypothetical protein
MSPPSSRNLILWLIIVVAPICLFTIVVSAILAKGYQHDTDPQAYEAWLVKNLGVQASSSNTNDPIDSGSVGYFDIEYWNGHMVTFYVPIEVWEAATKTECNPWLVVAVAFSESTSYFNGCNSIGACGTWQFMLPTWEELWPRDDLPSRLDIPSAADGACRKMKAKGMTESINESEKAFVNDFAIIPPVWNAYPPQAKFVYRLMKEIRAHGGETFVALPSTDTDPNKPLVATKVWWKKPIVFLFKELGIWPEEVFGYNPEPTVILPQEGDGLLSMPYVGNYTITQGLHGQWYGECAIDVSQGFGSTVVSPINGIVTQKYTDGLNNPIIQIENSTYLVKLYHGDWSVTRGGTVTITQSVGTEASHGNSTGPHTHFSVFVKGQLCINPQLLINYPPKGN